MITRGQLQRVNVERAIRWHKHDGLTEWSPLELNEACLSCWRDGRTGLEPPDAR